MIEISDIDPRSWSGIASLRGRCEAQAASEGLAGIELFFRGQALFSESLSRFPSYKERNTAWKSKQVSVASKDPVREALEQIRDGHNDARGLAAKVLSELQFKEPGGG